MASIFGRAKSWSFSESVQQLAGGQGLEFRYLFAESLGPGYLLFRLGCK